MYTTPPQHPNYQIVTLQWGVHTPKSIAKLQKISLISKHLGNFLSRLNVGQDLLNYDVKVCSPLPRMFAYKNRPDASSEDRGDEVHVKGVLLFHYDFIDDVCLTTDVDAGGGIVYADAVNIEVLDGLILGIDVVYCGFDASAYGRLNG